MIRAPNMMRYINFWLDLKINDFDKQNNKLRKNE